MTQNYDFLESNVNTFSMGGDQPNIKQLLRSAADNSRGTARPRDAAKGIPFDGQLWLDSVAREMYIYSISKTGGAGWIRLFDLYDGTMLQAPPNPALQDAWPEGSIFLTFDSINPGVASRLGFGEWTQIGEGRALCCIGQNTTDPSGSYTIGEGDGGFAFVTLAAENLPAHTHPFSIPGVRDRNVGGTPATQPVNEDGPTFNGVTGVNANAGQPFSNLGPYAPVYIWLRGADPESPILSGATAQSLGNSSLFGARDCQGNLIPSQTVPNWDYWRVRWDGSLYEDNYWTATQGVDFEILKTFSFWDATLGQLVHTFNQGDSGVYVTGTTTIILCVFDLIQDTQVQFHGMSNTSIGELEYRADFPDGSAAPSWYGNEIIVIDGTSPP